MTSRGGFREALLNLLCTKRAPLFLKKQAPVCWRPGAVAFAYFFSKMCLRPPENCLFLVSSMTTIFKILFNFDHYLLLTIAHSMITNHKCHSCSNSLSMFGCVGDGGGVGGGRVCGGVCVCVM